MSYSIMMTPGMAATTRERYIKGAERKMTILLWLWRLEEFCLKTELMFYIQELQMITISPFERARLANEAKVDFFISFHRNSSPEVNQYNGVEVLVYDKTELSMKWHRIL